MSSLPPAIPERAHRPEDAAGHADYQGRENDTQEETPILCYCLEFVLKQDKNKGPYYRPQELLEASEHRQ